MEDLEQRFWYGGLEASVKDLLSESVLLIKKVAVWTEKFSDYSFVVFPAAKAYEGFLKKVFLDLGFISQEEYYGQRFRIGKALNPSLDKKYRQTEGIYDQVIRFCGGDNTLADQMWTTWKSCRNLIFHFFPKEKNAVTFVEAQERIDTIIETMESVIRGCRIKHEES